MNKQYFIGNNGIQSMESFMKEDYRKYKISIHQRITNSNTSRIKIEEIKRYFKDKHKIKVSFIDNIISKIKKLIQDF